MRLGIFGGTFDPPHLGHLILADEARIQLDLDRVLWVLTPFPPHKTGFHVTPVAERLEMLQAALAKNPAFELSRVDIDRSPPHYAVDTLRLLRASYLGDTLVYLLGGDSLQELPTWHSPWAFVSSCDEIGVMNRPGEALDLESLEVQLPGLKARLRVIQTPLIDIASSQIRQMVARGGAFRYYMPQGVYAIVERKGLYLNEE